MVKQFWFVVVNLQRWVAAVIMRPAQAQGLCLVALAIASDDKGSQTSAKSHFCPRSGELLRNAATAAKTCSMTPQNVSALAATTRRGTQHNTSVM